MTANPQRNRLLVRVFDRIWYAASAPQTFLVLAAFLAGTFAFAAFIPQLPDNLTSAVAENWLSSAAANSRGAGAFLRAIGAYTVLQGPWLRVLLAALGFHLALRLADQLRVARSTLRPAQIMSPPAGLPAAESHIAAPLNEVLARVTAMLRERYGVLLMEYDATRAQVYVERHRAAAWAPVFALAGALLVLLGLLVDGSFGQRSPDFALAPGSHAALTGQADTEAAVAAIAGAGDALQAHVALTDGRGRREGWVAFGRPLRWGNWWVAQKAAGPALAVTATDAAGQPLLLQELAAGGAVGEALHLVFQETEGEQAFAIPARNLALRAVAYTTLSEQDSDRPVFLVEAFRGADPTSVASELVATEATLTVDDTTIALRRDHFVVLSAAYLPGLWLWLAGALLLLAGVTWQIGWGPTRAWVDMVADRDAVGIAARVAARSDARGRAERLVAACVTAASPEAADAG